uniref:beta strand repeat-containing protein n=1 Tax=Aliarcobacter butzleri TaxID=28197 RepID=UPI001D012F8F
VSAIAIQNALGGTNVELQADNNITVNQNITWSTDKQLKLSADNINVNATINNTNKTNGGVYFNAANNESKVVFGTNGKVIVNNVYQLQWINTALDGKYELGSNIDAGVTSSWNSNKGFNPIGDFSTSDNNSMFTGTFDGKGFTISDLYMNRSNTNYVGLFGYTNGSTIKNIGLENIDIKGQNYTGGLVGYNNNGTIQNSYATGSVTGNDCVGGLVAYNQNGTIQNSYLIGSVTGDHQSVGGLVGFNDNGIIQNSYASETVTRLSGTNTDFGGLLGANRGGTIQNSWYDNETNTNSLMGDSSSYGKTKAEIKSLIIGSSGEWETDLSKGRGYGLGGTTNLPFLKNVTKLSNSLFEDGLGTALNPYTITNWTQLQNINNNDTVFRSGKFFNLINNLDSSTTGYTTQASSTANGFQGWNPIGWNSGNRFKGTFDGLGFTISDLKISRSGTDYVGLFGYTDNATTTIKNLGLVDVAITGNNYVGGLVGRNENHSQIENSYVTGNVSGNWYVGGLVGVNSQGTIKNSYASGNVSGNYSLGGLVGFNYSSQIENSYASATVTRLSGTDTEFGGLVGYNNNSQIINSFYDKTKNPNFDNGLGIGKTTQELSYGGTFKTAPTPWDIRADSSINQTTPVLKYDSDEKTSYWAIAPIALNYNLGTKSTTYNGNVQNLGDFYTSNPFIIPTGYEFLGNIAYKFQKDGSDISGYKNAGTYSDIKLVSNNEFLSIATTGNTNGTLTINKKDLTIDNVTANNKTYDGNNTAILSNKGNLVGLVNNETLELNYATSEFSDKNAETGKTVTVTGYQIADKNGNLALNYNLTQTSKTTTANISKANLTIDNVTANNKTYDANNIATLSNKGNLVGLVNNETLELNYATSEFNNKNAGTGKTVTVNGYEIADKDGNLASNYNLTQTSKTTTANISKKDISNVSYTAENKTYDGNSNAIVSGSSSDFIANDKVGFTQTANFDNKNAGTGKDVNISDIVLSGVDAQNYNLTQTSKTTTADISKKDLTITANSMNKVYNGQIQSFSGYSVIGLVGDDRVSSLVISGDSVSGIKVGEYNTNLSGSDNNYNLTFVNGKLTITSKPIEPNKVVQNSEVKKVINSIQKSIQMPNSTQSLSNILSSVNNSTVDTQIQEQQNSNLLNTNQNIQTLTLGKNLGISIVNGGVNAPSVNIEEIKNLLSTQN